jgi:putative ABC transport system permease protein
LPSIATVAVLAAAGVVSEHVEAQSDQLPTVLISRQLSVAEGLAVNDTILFSTSEDGSNPRQFRIVGIYEPTPDPMRLAARRLEARVHLPDLLDLAADPADPSSAETITAINVKLTGQAEVNAFASDVLAAVPFPGLTVRAAGGDNDSANVFVVLDRFHLAIALVSVIASTVFLLALMVMLVDERREMVGILRLIGLRKGRLLLQVFAEGVLIAIFGALFGVVLAATFQSVVNAFFQWRYDTALVFVRITPRIALACSLLAVPLGVLAALVSSWTLLRADVLKLARR